MLFASFVESTPRGHIESERVGLGRHATDRFQRLPHRLEVHKRLLQERLCRQLDETRLHSHVQLPSRPTRIHVALLRP